MIYRLMGLRDLGERNLVDLKWVLELNYLN